MCDPLAYILDKFREIWRNGKDARIAVECHAGQAWMSFHHRLPSPPPSSPQSSHRRPSPSRIRRRARRALARAAAAQADHAPVPIVNTTAAMQTDQAVQTEMSKTVDATAQVDIKEAPLVAREANHDQHHHHSQGDTAGPAHQEGEQRDRVGQAPHRQVVIHVPTAEDQGPEDDLYWKSNPRIQQIDGNISSYFSQCNNCEKILETIEDYNWHFKTTHGREDCRLLRSMLTL